MSDGWMLWVAPVRGLLVGLAVFFLTRDSAQDGKPARPPAER